jgi:cobalt-zinc-cadmium efflux system protein
MVDEHHQHGNHEHDHSRGSGQHVRAPKDFGVAIGTALNLGFVIVEVVYGLSANSIALVADAGHNLGDVPGLVTARVATVPARRAPTETHTYGLRSGTILAALANAVFILMTVGAIAI